MIAPVELLIILLELVGVGITTYLIVKDLKKKPAVCLIGHDCDVVLKSKYSTIFGVKIYLFGFAYYVSMLALFIVKLYAADIEPLIDSFFTIAVILAAIASVILTYIQLGVLKSLCSWCLLSAATNILLLVTVLYYIT